MNDRLSQLREERLQWECEAQKTLLLPDLTTKITTIGGVKCQWVYGEDSLTDTLVLYLHGGGLITGSALTHQSLAGLISMVSGTPVLLVNYRLLPEHDYPAPLEDALCVYHSLIEDHGYSASRIVVGGDSSGAGLGLSLMLTLRDRQQPLPARAFFICGAFDMTLSGDSMSVNDGKDPLLTLDALCEWRDTYFGNPRSPQLSPLHADLHGLPAVLLLAGGKDLWLSDSTRLAEKICRSGGRACLRVWDLLGHVWMMDTRLEASQQAAQEIGRFVRSDG